MKTAVIAIGTAVSDSGWMPVPQRLTATLAIAASSGDSSSTAAARATPGPAERG